MASSGWLARMSDLAGFSGPEALDAVLGNGNDAGAEQIKNLADGTDPQDAATVAQIPATPGLGAVVAVSDDAGGNQLKNIADATDPGDAVALGQLAALDSEIQEAAQGFVLLLMGA